MNTITKIHENLQPIKLPFFTIFDWVILFILFSGLIFIFWKNQKKNPEIAKKTITVNRKFIQKKFLLEDEIKRLEELKTKEKWKEFSLESTKLLKKILEKKFKKEFSFATGKEVEELLKEKISTIKFEKIQTFFSILNPIKFAKVNGQKTLSQKVINILKNF